MGITYTKQDDDWDGAHSRLVRVLAAFDASYTNGGEALAASDADMASIERVVVEETVTESGYVVGYDESAGVLKAYASSGTAGNPLQEVADAADLSGETVTLTVYGRGSA
ncbi:hypothetical protein [Halocalculus aciditolerans]|uniref:Uncharacterized protein n=1 Tax=Halocalculus aciditolerans TaxID=1383812 RepID=A0A830FKC7_9EURY|nr:hypothetical protein [Halocalculus aciditolerans]GGL55125.1 hypothetical protein GCM10009039_11530 [Halocalculus aciditolerans]